MTVRSMHQRTLRLIALRLLGATVAAYDGEYLARGGGAELMEGELPLGRVVTRTPALPQP